MSAWASGGRGLCRAAQVWERIASLIEVPKTAAPEAKASHAGRRRRPAATVTGSISASSGTGNSSMTTSF